MQCLARSSGSYASFSRTSEIYRAHALLFTRNAGVWGWLALLFLVYVPSSSAAQDVPHDVSVVTPEGARLPDPPGDFVEARAGNVRLRFHPQNENLAQQLQRKLPAMLRKISGELGMLSERELELRVARGPREMAALAPAQSPPPPYAVGVAYPALGLIIVSVVDPQSWFPPNVEDVLAHELSHIALYRAAGERHLPLWFVEGLAIHQAGEQRLSRIQTLWEAAIVDEVLPLSALSASFPKRARQVNLAYAQSADVVEHLLRTQEDRARLPALLGALRDGASFDQALASAYHVDMSYLERDWKRSLAERYRVLPMLLTGASLWGGIALLLVAAFVRRRRQHRQKLQHWVEQEAAEDRALESAIEAEVPALSVSPSPPEPELFVLVTQPRDSTIPTVEHEGQRYTLH